MCSSLGTAWIKLLRPGFSEDSLRSEAEKAKAAILAGAPAPSAHGLERIDGRLGIVFERETPDRNRIVQIVDDIREAEIFALTDVDPDQVDEWELPVLADRLSEGIEHERAALLARIDQLIT